jgi:hypothetical protein
MISRRGYWTRCLLANMVPNRIPRQLCGQSTRGTRAIYENTPYASIFSRPPIDCLANIPGSKSLPRPLCDPLRVAAMKKTAGCLVLLYDRNKFIGSGRYILGSYIKWHVPTEIHQPEPKPQRRTRFPMI